MVGEIKETKTIHFRYDDRMVRHGTERVTLRYLSMKFLRTRNINN